MNDEQFIAFATSHPVSGGSQNIRQQLGLEPVNGIIYAPALDFNRYAANADPSLAAVAAAIIAEETAEILNHTQE
jgi:hypothetical protein